MIQNEYACILHSINVSLSENACLPNPCLNGAACSPNNGVATCRCLGSFTGTTCQQGL